MSASFYRISSSVLALYTYLFINFVITTIVIIHFLFMKSPFPQLSLSDFSSLVTCWKKGGARFLLAPALALRMACLVIQEGKLWTRKVACMVA